MNKYEFGQMLQEDIALVSERLSELRRLQRENEEEIAQSVTEADNEAMKHIPEHIFQDAWGVPLEHTDGRILLPPYRYLRFEGNTSGCLEDREGLYWRIVNGDICCFNNSEEAVSPPTWWRWTPTQYWGKRAMPKPSDIQAGYGFNGEGAKVLCDECCIAVNDLNIIAVKGAIVPATITTFKEEDYKEEL